MRAGGVDPPVVRGVRAPRVGGRRAGRGAGAGRGAAAAVLPPAPQPPPRRHLAAATTRAHTAHHAQTRRLYCVM